MPQVEGYIEAVSRKERTTKYGEKIATSFKMGDAWYSGGFKTWEVDKGDKVSLTYDTNAKGYHDVKGIAVIEKGAPSSPVNTGVPRAGRTFPIDALAPERTINRQNALTAAVNYTVGGDISPEDVIKIARQFEAYTTGDLDRDEAMEMIAAQQNQTGGIQT